MWLGMADCMADSQAGGARMKLLSGLQQVHTSYRIIQSQIG